MNFPYRKEEEQQRLKKKQEEEEEAAANAKKQEMLKRPMEALKKMQDQQMEPFKRPLPWCQTPVTAPGTSLSEIQKMQEREKKQVGFSVMRMHFGLVFCHG